jgi:ribosomal protein S18 acetylase RimI-like enzyme
VIVRDARAGELAGIGELRVAAYRAGGLLSANPGYTEVLRGLGVSGTGVVLVAEDAGRIVGTVMLEPFYHFSELARSPGEAEVRALAVAPHEQHRGAGRALVAAVIDRATVKGVHRLVLSAQPAMTAAQHLYRLAGFTRLPERDWSPVPGVLLLVFGLLLPHGGASTDRHRPGDGTLRLPARGDGLQSICIVHQTPPWRPACSTAM